VRRFRGAGRQLLRVPRPVSGAATLAWCGWIWWHSSKEGDVAVVPAFWWSWYTNLGHAPAFALVALGLAVLGLRGRREESRASELRLLAAVFVLATAYGAVDELHQSFVVGRSASWLDLTTDALGAGATLWIVRYVGDERATDRGLLLRLLVGTAACVLSAWGATVTD